MSKVHIYGGGTFSHVRNHLSLCAPAFGTTAKRLKQLLLLESDLHLTKMADTKSTLVTNDDIKSHVKRVCGDMEVKWIIMNVALCDYSGTIGDVPSDSHAERLQTRDSNSEIMHLTPAPKLITMVKEMRPDINIFGFKTTTNDTANEQIEKAKRMGVNMVLANDTVTRNNILVCESKYAISGVRRDELLERASSHIKQTLLNNNPIKNIRHSGKYTEYSVEVLGSTGRKHAFMMACDILSECSISGEYLDGRWSRHHENIYLVSTIS